MERIGLERKGGRHTTAVDFLTWLLRRKKWGTSRLSPVFPGFFVPGFFVLLLPPPSTETANLSG